jgi:PQQ-dependent dehydrogenase (methanol/ethanol family)
MMRATRLALGIAAAIGTMAGALPTAQAPAPAPSEARPPAPITAARLQSPEPGDWASYRRTYDVTAFSPLTQIDRTTVTRLRPVWSYSMRDNRRWLPTPVVANGLIYVPEGSGRVVAFDAVTGDVVWIHERRFPDDVAVSEAFPRHRGVSILGDTIYWGTADSYLVALDARTGQLRWEVKTGDYRLGEGHNHPPLIAEGKVFLPQAGGDLGARGQFRAFDAATGKLLWSIFTAPGPDDEPAFNTWTRRQVPPLGAAPWYTVSYDPELRLIYFSTGQPAPWSSALRGPGDALYANTVLAVEAATGKIRWHFQMNPADDWDRAAFESMLVDLPIGGRLRKVLIQTGKMGWGLVLDRQTGEFLRAFKTAYDNVVTGWTDKGRPIVNPATVPKASDLDSGKVFEICPHLHGARNVQAPSYSPLTGLYYLGLNNTCMDAKVVSAPYVPGRAYTGVTYTAKRVPGYDYVGEFVAFNPLTGERAWTYRRPNGAAMTASALATAGGVVFGGTADRQFFALQSETGALLWQTRLNGDISGAPITYTVDGTQYVAVAAGGRAAPATSFGPLTNADIPAGTGVLWVFALDTTAVATSPTSPVTTPPVAMSSSGVPPKPPARPATPVPQGATSAPAPSTSAASDPTGVFSPSQAARGEQHFARVCASCHAVGEQTGTSFTTRWGSGTLADLFTVMATTMPQGSPGSLAPEDYAAIVAFYLQRSGFAAGASDLPADVAALRGIAVASLYR